MGLSCGAGFTAASRTIRSSNCWSSKFRTVHSLSLQDLNLPMVHLSVVIASSQPGLSCDLRTATGCCSLLSGYTTDVSRIGRRTRDDHANVVPDESEVRRRTKKVETFPPSIYLKYIDSAQESGWSRGCAPNALLFGRPLPLQPRQPVTCPPRFLSLWSGM